MKRVFAEEWADPRDFLVLKNVGVMSFSILGGTVIDKCLARQKVGIEDMATYLRQVHGKLDWRKDGQLAGMTGNRAALIIAGELAAELSDETGISTKTIEERLLGIDAEAADA